MRVMLTGATGFIGYHTALALLDAGHEVSLLVRNPDKMEKLFGAGVIEHFTQGDITDATRVLEAMQDCDAVVHVAALVSTHAGDSDRVYRTNVEGTRNVIGGAVDLGIERIIHVSSVTALYNPEAQSLHEESPPGTQDSGYGKSKVACEKYVRDLQAAGHLVYITYPASVLGPEAPEMTEAHTGLQTYLAQFVPLMSSGNQYVDVRDIARAHLQILEQQPESRRFVLGGEYIPWRSLGALLDKLTGRRTRKIPFSGAVMRAAGALADRLTPVFNWDLPLTKEGLTYATRWVKMDDSRIREELDFQFTPVEDTLVDSIRWLYREGHITAEQAGRLAEL
jgi:nucleoside-diphosphate-sugar epimerase